MIRTDRLSLSADAFTAERKDILTRADERLRIPVKSSLARQGLPGWEEFALSAALDIFDETARAEVDQWSQIIDDLHDDFALQVRKTLSKTKPSPNRDMQVETLVRWLSTAAINGGTEAATTADPDPAIGLEWVTMHDHDVREMHAEVAGQTVPTGHPFKVGGEDLMYPGQPVGDPSVWINCRCMARPTMLSSLAGKTITAAAEVPGLHKDGTPPKCKYCTSPASLYVLHSEAMGYVPTCADHLDQAKEAAANCTPNGEPDPGNIDKVGEYALNPGKGNASDPGLEPGEEPKAAVVVLLPAMNDPITALTSGTDPHCTLLYLGNGEMDLAPLHEIIASYASAYRFGDNQLPEDSVSGRAVLGKDKADVALLDASGSGEIRASLMEEDGILELLGMQEQFPAWIPHLTLGYPEAPATEGDLPDGVTYDRLALWRGNEQYEFPLGEDVPVQASSKFGITHAEDPEFTQEMADAFVAAVPDNGQDDGEPDSIPEEEAYPEIPWHGVLAPEGKPSGDGRQFAPGSLRHRNLPLPLKWMPADAEGHDGSVIVGRIDSITRDGDLIKAEGVFDQSEAGYEALRQIATSMLRGVSVDVDDATAALSDDEELIEFSSGRIASATLCAIPAFAEAYVALGPWADAEPDAGEDTNVSESAAALAKDLAGMGATVVQQDFDVTPPKTMDGPGWITEPVPTHRITSYWVDGRGAAKIGWGIPGDFNRCRVQLAKYVQRPEWLAGLCANLHYRAIGVWPGQEDGGKGNHHGLSADSLTASVGLAEREGETLSADWFRDPGLTEPTPLTVTDEGRIFGHIATWDVCHISVGQACLTAPHSATNYAYFLTGEVSTDAGRVAVGQVTMGGGHATQQAGLRAAISHYDSTSAAVADVTVGEDDHGIWFAGALRPDVGADDRRALMAAALSGDWRTVRVGRQENLEMVAALAVNVPGFPIPRPSIATYGAQQISLTAASIPQGPAVLNDGGSHAIEDASSARVGAARASLRSLRAARAKVKMNIGGR